MQTPPHRVSNRVVARHPAQRFKRGRKQRSRVAPNAKAAPAMSCCPASPAVLMRSCKLEGKTVQRGIEPHPDGASEVAVLKAPVRRTHTHTDTRKSQASATSKATSSRPLRRENQATLRVSLTPSQRTESNCANACIREFVGPMSPQQLATSTNCDGRADVPPQPLGIALPPKCHVAHAAKHPSPLHEVVEHMRCEQMTCAQKHMCWPARLPARLPAPSLAAWSIRRTSSRTRAVRRQRASRSLPTIAAGGASLKVKKKATRRSTDPNRTRASRGRSRSEAPNHNQWRADPGSDPTWRRTANIRRSTPNDATQGPAHEHTILGDQTLLQTRPRGHRL